MTNYNPGWDSLDSCQCFEAIDYSYELYECCFGPASDACDIVSYFSQVLFLWGAIILVLLVAYKQQYILSDWSLIASSVI